MNSRCNFCTVIKTTINNKRLYALVVCLFLINFIFAQDTIEIHTADHYIVAERHLKIAEDSTDNYSIDLVAPSGNEKGIGYAINEYITLGIFYGIVILMIGFNFILFIYIKKKSYLFYVFYSIGVGWYSLSKNGLGFQYLWPDHPEWNMNMPYLAVTFAVVAQLLYTKYFLKLNKIAPIVNVLLFYFVLFRTAVFAIVLVVYRPLLDIFLLDIISLSLSFYAGIVAYRNGYKPARLFLLGFGFIGVGFILNSMESIGYISNGIVQGYATDIGASFQFLFLSLAFADQLKFEKKAKEHAQKESITELNRNEALRKVTIRNLEKNKIIKDKLKNELDSKVLERTLELKAANGLLKAQAEKINQLNSKIDLENNVLKKNIKEIIKSRVTHESIDFEAFNKIYPDEHSCYTYLNELKCGNGFSCIKCNSTHFSDGLELYSKRCTNCNYAESVTANTLFHKLKFPITKAFCILFMVTKNPKVTVDEIALTLAMRRNTCWDFKNKITTRIAESKNKELRNWELIILNKFNGI